MNNVTVSGWLQADPVTEHLRDLGVCELRLDVEWPGSPARTSTITVTCVTTRTVLAAQRLKVGDEVTVTGWLRAQPVEHGRRRFDERVDVVADRLDRLGHRAAAVDAPDAHLEAAYEDRYVLDEAL
jgi:single-stranded DNA-binding protein